jgi:hypothetical protein
MTVIMWLSSCTTYQSFVDVQARNDVPEGSKEILVQGSIETILQVLKAENILYTVNESGAQTEEIMLDEGTRARLNIYEFEGGMIKIVPYWGVTDAVRSEVAMWAGQAQAAAMTNELKRVIYKRSDTRPKKVFDYAVNIATKTGIPSFK